LPQLGEFDEKKPAGKQEVFLQQPVSLESTRSCRKHGLSVTESQFPYAVTGLHASQDALLPGHGEEQALCRTQKHFVQAIRNVLGAAKEDRQAVRGKLIELQPGGGAQSYSEHRLRRPRERQPGRKIPRVGPIGRLGDLQRQ
jgi:hypothetical protein